MSKECITVYGQCALIQRHITFVLIMIESCNLHHIKALVKPFHMIYKSKDKLKVKVCPLTEKLLFFVSFLLTVFQVKIWDCNGIKRYKLFYECKSLNLP